MSDLNSYFGEDAEMNAAVEEARHRLPEFRRALDTDACRVIPTIEGALVKARFQSAITGDAEHMWLEDAGFEGDNVVGTLANEPRNIPELSKGQWVSITVDALSDWAYRQGERTFGGFTIRVMQQRGQQWFE
jgi:uncharacterized protein YegJ (DUF2314 family)